MIRTSWVPAFFIGAQVFDDPQRDAWQKPHEVVQALALKPDAVIADIGSGTGYFPERRIHQRSGKGNQ